MDMEGGELICVFDRVPVRCGMAAGAERVVGGFGRDGGKGLRRGSWVVILAVERDEDAAGGGRLGVGADAGWRRGS